MGVLSKLSNETYFFPLEKSKLNMESDFEEIFFYRFSSNYPGYDFACLEKLKICKVPMLYYKDHIPDLEQCNISGEDDVVDAATFNIRNNNATKILS
jgi:hypothetical protein